ncbi:MULTISPECIES: tetratricopeptide repeat protein [unclassified Sphingosinithalassobacter]|uniref:tetratricopeptide repeat protein n=1 Tax=unclassified Sphingosinithalassobacter TaxID=2676235 RepID=UPI00165DF490|nr:cytochrome c biogenesis factor-like protein [Sphingosinithalassobacter sp. CS137]
MIGWIALALVALLAAVVLWLAGYPRRLWTFAATALMLGAAGYAWQGSPGLAGSTVEDAGSRPGIVEPDLVALRNAMYGQATFARGYFVAADAMTRRGNYDNAAAVMLGAVRTAPQDGSLWAGLGLALAQRDGNNVSPPAELAFDRAIELWPEHPGPPFYRGLAHVRAGDFAGARRWWARAVELTPEDASYRNDLVMRLFLLDRFLEQSTQVEAPTAESPQAR